MYNLCQKQDRKKTHPENLKMMKIWLLLFAEYFQTDSMFSVFIAILIIKNSKLYLHLDRNGQCKPTSETAHYFMVHIT